MFLKIKIFILFFFNLFLFINCFAQKTDSITKVLTTKSLYNVKDYPTGFYYTLNDFLIKNNVVVDNIERREIIGITKKSIPRDSIVNHVFFYDITNDTKFTDVFAISYNGNIYIQQKAMNEYAVKGDRNETGSNPNSFHRVLKDGNFFYMEGEFGNSWSKGIAYGSGSPVGGSIASKINNLKGVIFDFDKSEFNYFKNCKDFSEFIATTDYENKFDCGKTYINIETVRFIIDKIIK